MKKEAKDTILFVHGAWHGKWCWEKYFVKYFSDRNYNVVIFDLPGHDTPGKVKRINRFSIKDYVEALKIEVNKLNTLPIIISHSMGGLILQKFLEKGNCKKAILMASVPPYGVIKTTLKFSTKWYFYPSLISLNLFGLVNSNNKSKWAFFSERISDDELTEYTSKLCSESFKAFLKMLIPCIKINNHLNTPTLVIGAENDNIFSINDNKRTAKKYNADLIIMEDIAHDMMIDVNHEKASEQIVNWLKKRPATNNA